MRIGSRHNSGIPEVNLVPLMDVLMTVLTFFVILSMSLNGQQLLDIKLPDKVDLGTPQVPEKKTNKPFILGINAQGNIVRKNRVIETPTLVQEVKVYFNQQPNGQILVLADKSLSYSKVTQILKGLRSIGGQKVSLAIQPYKDK